MFHTHLDQTSKRYQSHPNVAAVYTSVPDSKSKSKSTLTPRKECVSRLPFPISQSNEQPLPNQNRPTSLHPEPPQSQIRDFAFPPSPINSPFLTHFTNFGFLSHHNGVDNGVFVSKAGVLSFGKANSALVQDAAASEEPARRHGFDYERENCPPCKLQKKTRKTKRDSASSKVLGRNERSDGDFSFSAPIEGDEEGGRLTDEKDTALISAVAVCMLGHMS